jgi:hypothetical protein
MIFVRVIFLIIPTIPFIFYRIYSLNIYTNLDNQFLIARNQLILTLLVTVFNTNFSVCKFVFIRRFFCSIRNYFQCDFYLFLLSSARYRRQVKYICIKNAGTNGFYA